MIASENADKIPILEAVYAQDPPMQTGERAALLFSLGAMRLVERGRDPAEAVPLLTEAADLWRRSGDRLYEADTETFLGLASLPDRAHLERALRLYRELEDVWGNAYVHYWLGTALWIDGDQAGARASLGEAIRLARTIDSDYLIGLALVRSGFVALAQGDHDGARGALGDAANLLLGVYGRDDLADCLYGFAALSLDAGDAEEAAVLLGAADATRERTGYFGSEKFDPATFEAISCRARTALGEGAFREAHGTGTRLGTREAVVRAMERLAVPGVT
jgi:tetratricopeptide (TPR) repeat protein